MDICGSRLAECDDVQSATHGRPMMGQVQPEGWAGALRMRAISAVTIDSCGSDIRRRCTVPAL